MTIKDYLKRYKTFYKDISEENKKKAEELMQRLANIAILIDECHKHLDEEGMVTEMAQGAYTIMRENPYCKILDQKVKCYLAIIEKLDKMMPSDKQAGVAKAGEALAAFIAKGK